MIGYFIFLLIVILVVILGLILKLYVLNPHNDAKLLPINGKYETNKNSIFGGNDEYLDELEISIDFITKDPNSTYDIYAMCNDAIIDELTKTADDNIEKFLKGNTREYINYFKCLSKLTIAGINKPLTISTENYKITKDNDPNKLIEISKLVKDTYKNFIKYDVRLFVPVSDESVEGIEPTESIKEAEEIEEIEEPLFIPQQYDLDIPDEFGEMYEEMYEEMEEPSSSPLRWGDTPMPDIPDMPDMPDMPDEFGEIDEETYRQMNEAMEAMEVMEKDKRKRKQQNWEQKQRKIEEAKIKWAEIQEAKKAKSKEWEEKQKEYIKKMEEIAKINEERNLINAQEHDAWKENKNKKDKLWEDKMLSKFNKWKPENTLYNLNNMYSKEKENQPIWRNNSDIKKKEWYSILNDNQKIWEDKQNNKLKNKTDKLLEFTKQKLATLKNDYDDMVKSAYKIKNAKKKKERLEKIEIGYNTITQNTIKNGEEREQQYKQQQQKIFKDRNDMQNIKKQRTEEKYKMIMDSFDRRLKFYEELLVKAKEIDSEYKSKKKSEKKQKEFVPSGSVGSTTKSSKVYTSSPSIIPSIKSSQSTNITNVINATNINNIEYSDKNELILESLYGPRETKKETKERKLSELKTMLNDVRRDKRAIMIRMLDSAINVYELSTYDLLKKFELDDEVLQSEINEEYNKHSGGSDEQNISKIPFYKLVKICNEMMSLLEYQKGFEIDKEFKNDSWNDFVKRYTKYLKKGGDKLISIRTLQQLAL